ncbi:MAG: glycosyltransferase family 39 protein, partial [Burkholderiales bacterium]|nr:glycosyltransferase family 39 protein [Burkholderiales bacterium]
MLINRKLIYGLIIIAFVVECIGIFQPLLRNDDPVLYAIIAKNMVLSNNWIGLFMNGQPWLDKPHFPFWAIAFSFKIFGINSFAYNLPGFLFFILGGIYTYKLAKLLYNKDVALVSFLIYLTSLHLMMSTTIDLRAEAYMLGQIMPACYYWLRYDNKFSIRYLVLASLFSALAMMTKGPFVVFTIFSGLVITWIYTGQFKKIISGKWLVAYTLTLIFILPELITLYLQFDAHPDLYVFGKQ